MKLFRDPLEFSKIISTLKGKLCGLDLSPNRIGIALSDIRREISLPMAVLHNDPNRTNTRSFIPISKDKAIICRLRQEYVAGWVVGWPLDLQPGPSQQRRLNETLHQLQQLPMLLRMDMSNVLLHDERFSTVMGRVQAAEWTDGGASVGGIDALAASVILKEFLDYASRSHTLLQNRQQQIPEQ